MTNKKILLISPEPWGDNYVSKHHYAQELSRRGSIVYFLNGPSSLFKLQLISDNLKVVDYKPIFRGLSKMPLFISSIFTKWEISRLEGKLGHKFDVIWNFDSSRFFNLSGLKNKLKVCHIVDMAENLHRDILARTSDVCFCTSDFIKEELEKFNESVYKVHHGYKEPSKESIVQESFSKKRIQVGVVGNLARECIDWDSIFKLVEEHTEIDFNFIGSYKTSNLSRININTDVLKRLRLAHNVNLLGEKPSFQIPSYLSKFDLLLCAYKMNSKDDVAQHSNLHKIMEYLGSGKVVLTSYVDEYKANKDLVIMVPPNGDFSGAFKKVISNLDEYNSICLQGNRKAFALDNTYSKQLNRIELILSKYE